MVFLRLVPNGLLPALTVPTDETRVETITESQVIMELLDRWHPPEDGYKPMMPQEGTEDRQRYDRLARLERELFGCWCTFMFRPENTGPMMSATGGGGAFDLGNLFFKQKSDSSKTTPNQRSPSFRAFVDCLTKVDRELQSTPGPWFFSDQTFDHPTMIDLVFISHVERMLASCAYWKGYQIRSSNNDNDNDKNDDDFPGLNAWLDAFDRREPYLAFKSDYYTNVMDIPPQYGPAYVGGDSSRQPQYEQTILGRKADDGSGGWHLPLPHDEPLEPLYRGPPLPTCVLEANGLRGFGSEQPPSPSSDATQRHAMARACRHMAGWKLASNGPAVARFSARGGSAGANNPRKTFAAPLADPYAKPDVTVLEDVETVLQIVAAALLEDASDRESEEPGEGPTHEQVLDTRGYRDMMVGCVSNKKQQTKKDICSSLAYLRDRVGVPRDLPLASARHLRAHLNWAIDVVESVA